MTTSKFVKNLNAFEENRDHTNKLKTFLNSASILEMTSAQVKTTMNTVLGFLNLSKDERLSQQTRDIFTNYVYTSSSALLQLFNNLTELYQIHNGSDNYVTSRIDLNDLLIDLQTKYQKELKYRDLEEHKLTLHLPVYEKKHMLNSVKNKLVIIIEALLQNAIDFGEEGKIDFGYVVNDSNDFEFYFYSKGTHFSTDQLEVTLSEYIKNPSGLDIGMVLASIRLEVAKLLVKRIGGTMWATSKPGSNYGFHFTLTGEKKRSKMNGSPVVESTRPDWSKFKVLIAEDVESNFMLLKSMLTPTKIKTDRAANGLEAVRLYKENNGNYDLILMDIMMPEMDGFEAASLIKGLNSDIPVIGQTAYCLESEDVEGKLRYFDNFLTKPIWDHELIRMMNNYLVEKG